MRFTVVTYGSEGDTRPFVALCRGLMASGHEVRLFAEGSSIHNAHSHGVPAETLAGNIRSTLPLDNPMQELGRSDVIAAIKAGLRVVNENTPAWMRAVTKDARGGDAVLFSGLASPVGSTVAEELKKPGIALWLQPTSPTREFASPTLRSVKLPGWLNRLSYCVSPQAMIRRMYGKSSDAARAAVFADARARRPKREFPILYGFSGHLVPRPDDWPESHRICGHWTLPPHDWEPSAALLDFLSAGPPPLYVGFGAISSFVRQKGLSAIKAAIGDRRTLFSPGWSRITTDMLPKNFFVLGDTPHVWLFPLTSMVIHHAGAGTTHTAARSGVPSIPLPFGVDQFFWAARLAAAGVAPRYMAGTRIDAKSLGAMIEFAGEPGVRKRARMLGQAITEEDGIANAVAAIESAMRSGEPIIARPMNVRRRAHCTPADAACSGASMTIARGVVRRSQEQRKSPHPDH
ncbi:MAG: glycosyltransferase [Steroidobacteraceae bacterium]